MEVGELQLLTAVITAVIALVACIGTWLVVPELRRKVGLAQLPGAITRGVRRLTKQMTTLTKPAQRIVRALTLPSPSRPLLESAEPTGWLLILADGYRCRGMPAGLAQRFEELSAAGQLRQFSYCRSRRGWLLLYGPNGYVYRRLPQRLRENLVRANQMRQGIRQVVFGSRSSWLLLLHDGRYVASGVPLALRRKLDAYRHDELDIKRVSLGPGQSWVVLLGRNGFRAQDTPGDLREKLTEYNRARKEIKQVVLLPTGGWLVLYGRNGYCAKGVPSVAVDALQECQSSDLGILDMSFAWFAD